MSSRFEPKLTGTVPLGGIVRCAAHPARPGEQLNGGPQMVEVSRDGMSVYLTNRLYTPWTTSSTPDVLQGWMAKLDVQSAGGITIDPVSSPSSARASGAPGLAAGW